MSTTTCFHGDIRKISTILVEKKKRAFSGDMNVHAQLWYFLQTLQVIFWHVVVLTVLPSGQTV